MYSLGATINTGNYQSLRIDVSFPLQSLPPGWTFRDARAWVRLWFQFEVERVVRRERSRGGVLIGFNLDVEPDTATVIPPSHPDLPLPPPHEESIELLPSTSLPAVPGVM